MSFTYTKLSSSITESTIWQESDTTRIVWITMLAMADSSGCVWGSIPGLANRARVSLEACEEALLKLLSPDKYSRTKDHEGRRLREIDGGWLLTNHGKHRAAHDPSQRRDYWREYKRRKAENGPGLPSVPQCGSVERSGIPADSIQADTNADTEAQKRELLPEAVMQLPAVGRKFYAVTRGQVERWEELFPAIDVVQCLRSMVAWLEANPKNRKTTSGMARFVANWLSREQNKAPRNDALSVRPKKEWTQGDPSNPGDWAAAEIREEDCE